MTISDTPTTYRYEGNGVTDTFAYNARVFNASDLVVEIITRATDALADTLTLTTDYSVTIADNGTASIVVTAPNIPSTLQDIQIRRALDKTQSVSLPTGTVFPARDVESAIDRAVAISQDIAADLERTAKVPVGFSGTDVVLPLPSDGKALIWSGTDGLMINGPTAADISNAQSYAEDAETAKDAAETAQAAAELALANLPLNNEMGSGAPTVNDDSGDGYSVGSKWYDLSASPPEAYLCLGSTVGAAIWVQTTVDSEDLGTAAFVDVIDEDDMATDSATRPPSQQSVKAYVDGQSAAFKGALLTKSANQSISNNTNTIVTFDQETYDTDAAHDNVTNNSRITIPAAWDGKKIMLSVATRWATHDTGFRNVGIYKNGAAISTGGRYNQNVDAPAGNGVNTFGFMYATAATGDYYEVNVYQNSGGALNLERTGSDTWFAVQVLG